MPISVSSRAQLEAAFSDAPDGARIELEPGTYPGAALHDRHFRRGLVIASRDPASPARMTEALELRNVTGLTITQVHLAKGTKITTSWRPVRMLVGGAALAATFILALMMFGWIVRDALVGKQSTGAVGAAAAAMAAFPNEVYQALGEIKGAVTGESGDTWLSVPRPVGADYAAMTPVASMPGIGLSGLVIGGDPVRARRGWRLVSGAFVIDGEAENAVLLMDPDLRAVRVWRVEEAAKEGELQPQPDSRKLVHGLEVLGDGSLLVTLDGGVTLQRYDACGNRVWSVPGLFSHSINLDAGGESVWVVREEGFAEVALADGAVLREISVDAIMAANPEIDILGIRQQDINHPTGNPPNEMGRWAHDSFHFNDVEPLPAARAARFPGFEAGDLLISARSLNLVFVLDPETLRVKWWRIGLTQRQHDPDWAETGEIVVFDNRMNHDYSRVVALDVASPSVASVLLDGSQVQFFSRIRGKQQLLSGGYLIVTSPQQGEAFEVDATGTRVLEFANPAPGDSLSSHLISELRWLPPEALTLTPCDAQG